MNMKLNPRVLFTLLMVAVFALGARNVLALAEERGDKGLAEAKERVSEFFKAYDRFYGGYQGELARGKAALEGMTAANAGLKDKIEQQVQEMEKMRVSFENEKASLKNDVQDLREKLHRSNALMIVAKNTAQENEKQIKELQKRWQYDTGQLEGGVKLRPIEIIRTVQQLKDASAILEELQKIDKPGTWSQLWEQVRLSEGTAQARIALLSKYNVTLEQFNLLRDLVKKVYSQGVVYFQDKIPLDHAGLIGGLLNMLDEAAGRPSGATFQERREHFNASLNDKLGSMGLVVEDLTQTHSEEVALLQKKIDQNPDSAMKYFYLGVLNILNTPSSSVFYVQSKKAREFEAQRDLLLNFVNELMSFCTLGDEQEKLARYDQTITKFLEQLTKKLGEQKSKQDQILQMYDQFLKELQPTK